MKSTYRINKVSIDLLAKHKQEAHEFTTMIIYPQISIRNASLADWAQKRIRNKAYKK